MTEENISVIGMIIIFIMVGVSIGSMITGCLLANFYVENLCVKLYSNTQDYKACLDKPWKEIIEEINK